jgi:hypothetical protein
MGEAEGAALRVRNRMEHRSFIIEIPSVEVTDLVLSFDVHRSGSGMLINHFEYTLDGGETWLNEGVVPQSINITESYTTHVIDFTAVEGANNNPDFAVRITYEGNIQQSNGNNRYDNIAVFGKTVLSSVNLESSNALSVYPNPSNGIVTVSLTPEFFKGWGDLPNN